MQVSVLVVICLHEALNVKTAEWKGSFDGALASWFVSYVWADAPIFCFHLRTFLHPSYLFIIFSETSSSSITALASHSISHWPPRSIHEFNPRLFHGRNEYAISYSHRALDTAHQSEPYDAFKPNFFHRSPAQRSRSLVLCPQFKHPTTHARLPTTIRPSSSVFSYFKSFYIPSEQRSPLRSDHHLTQNPRKAPAHRLRPPRAADSLQQEAPTQGLQPAPPQDKSDMPDHADERSRPDRRAAGPARAFCLLDEDEGICRTCTVDTRGAQQGDF